MRRLDDILLLFIILLLFDSNKLSKKNLPKALMLTLIGNEKGQLGEKHQKPVNPISTEEAKFEKPLDKKDKNKDNVLGEIHSNGQKGETESNYKTHNKDEKGTYNNEDLMKMATNILGNNPNKADIMNKILQMASQEKQGDFDKIAQMAKMFTDSMKSHESKNTIVQTSADPHLGLLNALKPFCTKEQCGMIETVVNLTESAKMLEIMEGGLKGGQ